MNRIEISRIRAERDRHLELDEGFFVITLDRETRSIRVESFKSVYDEKGHVITGKPEHVIEDPDPVAIYQTVIRMGLVKKLDHAAYLGRELTLAELALRTGEEYTQDDDPYEGG